MSLSSALTNALSGLTANARAADMVATNISNASTPNYGRRTLSLSSSGSGYTGGVRVDSVVRHVNEAILSDRRMSDASLAGGETAYTFARNLELSVGSSDDAGSLTNRVIAFENALLTAASNPSSTQRLESVAFAADALAVKLNDLSQVVQDKRTAADAQIAAHVETLNVTMEKLDKLNGDIVATTSRGGDLSSLLDERQGLLDDISDIVPVHVRHKERGEISIYTTGGAILLDGRPSVIEFSNTYVVSPGHTLSGGPLSGLTLNGMDINSTSSGMFAGGDLAAQLDIRDVTAVERQAELDGIARDLVERLGPGGPDTTLGAADPGLFTDLGAAFDPLNELGFASRIQLNALVEPGNGGSWRLRDGLGAAAPGSVGDGRLLQGIGAAISASAVPSSTALPPVTRSFSDRVADFSSDVTSRRVREEAKKTYLSTQNTILSELELSSGVDTDQELQHLMKIEQHYAANARMMSVVDELLERLMAI